MSNVEVSMMTANHKLEHDAERYNRRPQRPPPPPPSVQVQPPVLSVQKLNAPTALELSHPSSEITKTTSMNMVENDPPTLLMEFKNLFHPFNFDSTREQILNRQLIDCSFTTVLWRIFLNCLPHDSNQWNEILDKSRHNYDQLVRQYTTDPHQINADNQHAQALNHPLTRDENCLWGQYFKDQELKETILKDVIRSFPDVSFFRDQNMIDLQLRQLFIHNRHNKQTPYKQGMHEILGVVLYTIHMESLKVNKYDQSTDIMKKIYDTKYLEHDSFFIFENIMNHLRNYYAFSSSTSPMPKLVSTQHTKQVPFQHLKIVHIPLNENAKQINTIAENLINYDKPLYDKLEELKIEPAVYGTRWLRVLFSREIPFESIPSLWTVIFCFDENFGFINHFFIALMVEIGNEIGKQGEMPASDFLLALMKQNIITHSERVIRRALRQSGKILNIAFEIPQQSSNASPSDEIPPTSTEISREDKPPAKIIRVPLVRVSEPHIIRPITIQPAKSLSHIEFNPSNYQMDQIKTNVNDNIQRSPSPKPIPSNPLSDSVTEVWAGKTTKQQLEHNRQLQETCADYMNKFIGRIEQQICNVKVADEEDLKLQLNGLKQIAHVLKYNDRFNSASFQAIIDFKSQKKLKETIKNKTDEQS